MARKTADEAQKTRDAILDAAEKVFSSRGVSAATMNDLAETAGVSRGAVYGHYSNKIEVALAMCQRALVAIPMPLVEPGQSPMQVLLDNCMGFLSLASADSSLQRVLEVLYLRCEPNQENEPLVQLREQIEIEGTRSTLLLLEQAVAQGELPAALDARLACAFIQSLVSGLYNDLIFSHRLDKVGAPGVRALVGAGLDTLRRSPDLHLTRK